MSIRDILTEESRRLDEIITMAMEDLEKAPQGSLVTKHSEKRVCFYMYNHGKITYLSKAKDLVFIRTLAQKKYAQKVLKNACRQKVILDRFLAGYDPESVSGILRDGRHDGLLSPYMNKPLEDEPSFQSPGHVIDLGLVSQLKDICSRLLGN